VPPTHKSRAVVTGQIQPDVLEVLHHVRCDEQLCSTGAMTRQERTPVTTLTQTPGTSSFAARRRSVHPSRTPSCAHLSVTSIVFPRGSTRFPGAPLRAHYDPLLAGKKPRADLARCQLANPTPHRAEGTQLAPRWRLRPGRRTPRRFSGASVRAVYKPVFGVLGRFRRPARRTSTPSGATGCGAAVPLLAPLRAAALPPRHGSPGPA
jgi:hypothetical protein